MTLKASWDEQRFSLERQSQSPRLLIYKFFQLQDVSPASFALATRLLLRNNPTHCWR